MNELNSLIHTDFIHMLMVTVFSLLIGLSQKHLRDNDNNELTFGTDRTFTFIGLLGFVLYLSDPQRKLFFIAGAVILSLFLAIHYYNKIMVKQEPGMTSVLVALLTYAQSALLITQPVYVYLFYIVIILILSELKKKLTLFSQQFEKEEFITLAKFICIAGIILPILPDEPIVSYLTITPYKIWLAMVVISTISYISYLLRKFVFKNSGLLVVGILGGLYSSTATTVVLARQSKSLPARSYQISAGIILAQAMMYLRITILAYVFNKELANMLAPYLIILIGFSLALGFAVYFIIGRKERQNPVGISPSSHPLEFNVALLFTALYILFTFVNYYAIKTYGSDGLHFLAVIVGVTDIDPFLLNMFQGNYQIAMNVIASASLLAIVSNNVLKAIYGLSLFPKGRRKWLAIGFAAIIAVNVLFVIII